MPLIKIDYVVSFSSEDPENPASNLLLPDVKSKWLCNKGEPSCSVVLQLKNACKIDSITIGAYHVSLIEVLVGLSEKPNDPFQVLVPSCVLLAPAAARRAQAAECVRSFGAAQLADAAARRWDRVRLVCAQPYNKHCKYGLAFVHISGPDGPPAPAPAALRLPLDADSGSSDDEFRPGALFATHRRNELARQSTEAQIRQASSQALNNIADASTELAKAPICKTGSRGPSPPDAQRSDRRKESLLYAAEDGRPHAKIDRVVQRHRDLANKRGAADAAEGRARSVNENESTEAGDRGQTQTPQKTATACNSKNSKDSHSERKRLEEQHPELGPVCASLRDVLPGVVVAMSGYVNPRRAALRDAALHMGARYLRDWQPHCTHLICAFPNTPKLRAVRAAGAATVAVRAEWLERCARSRRRLPWRWFATEPRQRRPAPPSLRRELAGDPSDGDTDDEIEKVLKQQGAKRRRTAEPDRRSGSPPGAAPAAAPPPGAAPAAAPPPGAAASHDSDDAATDEDERAHHPDSVAIEKELPAPWAGRTFLLAGALGGAASRLARYVFAYGGLALMESEVVEGSRVHLVVARRRGEAAAWAGPRVRPAWVWRQHARHRRAGNTIN